MIINVECNYCGKSFNKKIDEISLAECSSDTRSMGEEKNYKVLINSVCPNPKCRKELKEINIFEYPEGVYFATAE